MRIDDILWLLNTLCQLFCVPFDPRLTAQNCPTSCTADTLLEALVALGFSARITPLRTKDLLHAPMPAAGFLQPQDSRPAHDTATTLPPCDAITPLLILRADTNNVLCVLPGRSEPEIIPVVEMERRVNGTFLFLTKAPSPEAGVDPASLTEMHNNVRFGFRWFIPELLKYRGIWRDVLIASLAIHLLGLGTPLFTQVVIDKVVVHQTWNTLLVVAGGMAIFILFSAVMTWLRQYLVLHTGNRIDAALGSKFFSHLLCLPMPYFEARPTGALVTRLNSVESIRQFVSGAAVTLLLDCPFLLVFLAVMFAYSWQLSLIALSCMSLISALSLLVTPAFRTRLNRQFLLGARNQAFMTEYVSGMATVKALQMEPTLKERFDHYLASYLAAGFSTRQLSNSYSVTANLLEQVMTLSILGMGAALVMRNDGFTIGQLVAFQMFAGRMSQPLLRLVGLWQEFQQADIAVQRLGDIMNMPAEPHAQIPSRTRKDTPGRIAFHDVSFRYGPEHPNIYRNLNLTFEPGQLTMLTGPSGCGKSTLTKLLLGFRQPTDGRISIDGQDIRHMSANELRILFGVVPQETVLFSGTVYDNLILANPHAGFQDVVMTCRHAGIHEAIEALPGGYQTELGEHGVGLSGGQRQRIAIARALLKRPGILIFDEAAANLDQETAKRFTATVNSLKGHVTIIFITHHIPEGLQVDAHIRLQNTSS